MLTSFNMDYNRCNEKNPARGMRSTKAQEGLNGYPCPAVHCLPREEIRSGGEGGRGVGVREGEERGEGLRMQKA